MRCLDERLDLEHKNYDYIVLSFDGEMDWRNEGGAHTRFRLRGDCPHVNPVAVKSSQMRLVPVGLSG